MQLASARAEQERLEAEARRMRDSAHEQQLSVMRQSLTASKVRPPLSHLHQHLYSIQQNLKRSLSLCRMLMLRSLAA